MIKGYRGEVLTRKEAVEKYIDQSVDYYAGEIETLRSKVNSLTFLVTELVIASSLSDEQVARMLGFSWEKD